MAAWELGVAVPLVCVELFAVVELPELALGRERRHDAKNCDWQGRKGSVYATEYPENKREM